MLEELLQERKLPDLFTDNNGQPVDTTEKWQKRREELKAVLEDQFYGKCQVHSKSVQANVIKRDDKCFLAGKAIHETLKLTVEMEEGNFSFPCHLVLPKTEEKVPIFVYMSFEPGHVEELLPTEEIVDGGFGVACFCYEDIATAENDGCTTGMGAFGGRVTDDAWGKVAMWAWAASRFTDYLVTRGEIDVNRIAVAGHSRLGKAALVAGANDERFSLVISNDSGGAGAAIFRGKEGEMVKNFREGGTSCLWFCKNFPKYIRREYEMPFDMHFLTALIAPRNLYISSAEEDLHADPKSEFLNAVETSKVYGLLGKEGLITPDCLPETNQVLGDGNIGYHRRRGTHFLSRFDWQQFMAYRKDPKHIC